MATLWLLLAAVAPLGRWIGRRDSDIAWLGVAFDSLLNVLLAYVIALGLRWIGLAVLRTLRQ